MNRITRHAEGVQALVDAGGQDGALSTPEQIASFEKEMAIDSSEHFAFQEAQAYGHMAGNLTQEEAQTIYMALGEVQNDGNGGWQPQVSLALKVTITLLMKELILAKMSDRMRA
jgi:hypothetical protein